MAGKVTPHFLTSVKALWDHSETAFSFRYSNTKANAVDDDPECGIKLKAEFLSCAYFKQMNRTVTTVLNTFRFIHLSPCGFVYIENVSYFCVVDPTAWERGKVHMSEAYWGGFSSACDWPPPHVRYLLEFSGQTRPDLGELHSTYFLINHAQL